MKILLVSSLFLFGCVQNDSYRELILLSRTAPPGYKACTKILSPEELRGEYCLNYIGPIK